MEAGAEVWIKDKKGDQSWLPALVHSKELLDDASGKVKLTIKNEFGEEFTFTLGDSNEDNPDLKLRNDITEVDVENLISLPYLHEPAILFCLQRRYGVGDIYTYTGPILIAMNPFKAVPLYSSQVLEVYYNSGLLKSQGIESGKALPPHVYAIADSAYRDMMNVILHNVHSSSSSDLPNSNSSSSATITDHSILISGESGAGKTESTKIVLRYLTTVGKPSGGVETETGSVMDKVLQSNPILEAFGNARTLRNDNSSRFGKFIQLNFNKRGCLIGGGIRTYLLEKVRLPSQQRGERNFHIFYQMSAGCSSEERDRWGLGDIEQYEYVLQGGVFVLQSINDASEFGKLKSALNTLNFSPADQQQLLDLTASLLHLGQIEFQEVHDSSGEGSEIAGDAESQESLQLVSQLCCLDPVEITRTLTVRTMETRGETYQIRLSAVQAADARHAVAKAIYGRAFDWIVRTINRSIEVDPKEVKSNIGVLDIFGFECFVHNSFEQLCINYTNETLQQQFNQYIFKMEQIEYQKEEIEWSFIEFPDNQDCLDLIEHKTRGILSMINDQCRLPQSSDEKLAAQLYRALAEHARFSAAPGQKRDHKFCVHHYAGPVVYSTITFVEKNKDELPKEATALLQNSASPLLKFLFTEFEAATAGAVSGLGEPVTRRGSGISKSAAAAAAGGSSSSGGCKSSSGSGATSSSVGAQFKEQLHKLMESIYATKPHYIRCLKPNDENVPDSFNRLRITEQLRYGGVLEAVRVARSGFPVRLAHADFFSRYRPLANPFCTATKELPAFCDRERITAVQLKTHCEKLLLSLWDESLPDAVAAGQQPSPTAAQQQLQLQQQKMSRRRSRIADMMLWQSKREVAQESVQLGLTKVFLRKPAHDVLESRRSRRILSAVRRIQSQFRCFQMRSWFSTLIYAQRLLLRVTRGMLARSRARNIRRQRAALKLQCCYRRFHCEMRFQRFLYAVISLQASFRGKKAITLTKQRRVNLQAVQLQRLLRGMTAQHRWLRFRSAVVVLQNRLRKRAAVEQLKQLRVAAKDVGKLQQSNEALKNEIELLKKRAAEENERLRVDMEKRLLQNAREAQEEELSSLRSELENAYKLLDIEKQLHLQAQERLKSAELQLCDSVAQLAASHAVIQQRDEVAAQYEAKLLKSEESLAIAHHRISYLERSHMGSPSFDHHQQQHQQHHIYRSESGGVGSIMDGVSRPSTRSGGALKAPVARRHSSISPASTRSDELEDSSINAMSPRSSIASARNGRGNGSNPPSRSGSVLSRRSSTGAADFSSAAAAAHAAAAAAAAALNGAGGSPDPMSAWDAAAALAAIAPANMVPFEEHRHALIALERETQTKQVLEEEVSRLRHISMDYKAQLDSLRKAIASTPTPSSTTAAVPAMMTQQPQLQQLQLPQQQQQQLQSSEGASGKKSAATAVSPLLAKRSRAVSSRNLPPRSISSSTAATNTAAAAAAATATTTPMKAVEAKNIAVQEQLWSKAWDDEDDSSVEGGVSSKANPMKASNNSSSNSSSRSSPMTAAVAGINPALARSASSGSMKGNPVDVKLALSTFEKNIESFRSKMKQGVKAFLWEGQRVANVEIIFKLDASNTLLTAEVARRGFGLFQSRVDVAPVGLLEIVECLPGAEINANAADQSLLLTIVVKSDNADSRILALKFPSRDVRNSILTGLRTLAADVTVTPSLSKASTAVSAAATAAAIAAVDATSSTAAATGAVEGRSNPMQRGMKPQQSQSQRELALGDRMAQSSPVATGAPQLSPNRKGRLSPPRLRLNAAATTATDTAASGTGSNTAAGVAQIKQKSAEQQDSNDVDEAIAAVVEDLHKKLHDEQRKNDRIMIQLVVMANDLNDRDEQISLLKKKEEHYEQTLIERDNMYKQDAMVRMQLGKRLEKVLMDKEEAMEKLEMMREQLETVQKAFK